MKTLLTILLLTCCQLLLAENINGIYISASDFLEFKKDRSLVRLCPACKPAPHSHSKDIIFREYSHKINHEQLLDLMRRKYYQKVYLGIGDETGTVYFINFGNIEGPFAGDKPPIFKQETSR